MGQKVGGYRRNVPYGKETRRVSQGWTFDVNPTGTVGWNRGTSGRKEDEYGKELNDSRRLRKELEEVRKQYGCESNGLGRKGTKRTGYTVYGEYRSTGGMSMNSSSGNLGSTASKVKGYKTRIDETQLNLALERVVRGYEDKRNCKVDRKRKNLKDRRKQKGIERLSNEKEERQSVLGHSTKRRKASERCETIALSGVIPVTQRRTNRIVGELEGNLNHIEILRNRETLRTHHARSSQYGRKRLGEQREDGIGNASMESTGSTKGGYYGLNVTVKGPLEGSRRTLSYVVQRGTVPRGTKRARIMTSHEHAKTTYGTLGVRVTYCYGRG